MILIPNTSSFVGGHDGFLAVLDSLRSVPQIKINQHATYRHVYPTHPSHNRGTIRLPVLVSTALKGENLISNSVDRDDACSPNTHFFLGPVFKVVS